MRRFSLNQSRAVYEEESVLHSKGGHVSLIRKELVTLTGNHTNAVILNQLLYWTQKTKDFSLMLVEEKNRERATEAFPQKDSPQYGWIYKTANALVEETMLHIDRTTLRRYLKFLVKQKWLFERSNPQNKWNKTIQYRVNVQKIQKDLMALGLSLSEIPLSGLEKVNLKCTKEGSRPKEHSNVYLLPLKSRVASSNGQTAHSNEQNARSDGHNAHSSGQIAHSKTENTTEITNKEHTQRRRAREEKDFFEEVLSIWKTCTPQESPVYLTEERKQRLHSILALHFQNDLTQWKQFCERVSYSPFLMGRGSRKWRVSLDWILVEENLIKVLEGNFDDGTLLEQKAEKLSEKSRKEETNAVLASIEDPMWREWCSQLDFESRNAVSLGELKSIANAKFLEVEGDRLVWIGSSDPQVLSSIEDLRLKILPLTQKAFPKVRNLRTRLCEDPSVLQKEINQQPGEFS